jgi:hypothetical protein
MPINMQQRDDQLSKNPVLANDPLTHGRYVEAVGYVWMSGTKNWINQGTVEDFFDAFSKGRYSKRITLTEAGKDKAKELEIVMQNSDEIIANKVARRILAKENITFFYAIPYEKRDHASQSKLLMEISNIFNGKAQLASSVGANAFYGFIDNSLPKGKTKLDSGIIQPIDSHGKLL